MKDSGDRHSLKLRVGLYQCIFIVLGLSGDMEGTQSKIESRILLMYIYSIRFEWGHGGLSI